MKLIDHLLRHWRTCRALAHCPPHATRFLDIGCGADAYLLKQITAPTRHGIEPLLRGDATTPDGVTLFRESFPDNAARLVERGPYDVIFALAFFEHLPAAAFAVCQQCLPDLLAPGGRLVITAPHPRVDRILAGLKAMRLIDGMELHQHHGFDPDDLARLASDRLPLTHRERFQLGLNNVFVFTRV